MIMHEMLDPRNKFATFANTLERHFIYWNCKRDKKTRKFECTCLICLWQYIYGTLLVYLRLVLTSIVFVCFFAF